MSAITRRAYLVGLGIESFVDPCHGSRHEDGADGVMRVRRGGGYQYATLAGPLGTATYSAVGKVRQISPAHGVGWGTLWDYGRWMWRGEDWMAVACSEKECGLLLGKKLQQFVPLGADRITELGEGHGWVAYHRPEGWYVLEAPNVQRVLGPLPADNLYFDVNGFYRLLDRELDEWQSWTEPGRTRWAIPQLLEPLPPRAVMTGKAFLGASPVLGIPAVQRKDETDGKR